MAETTLVLQSCRPAALEGWIGTCTASAKAWATNAGFDYEFRDDGFFDTLPGKLRDKLAGRGPIKADLARLYAAREALEHFARFVWLDADVLIFAPEHLSIDTDESCAFGREIWVESDGKGRLRMRRNVHNAIMVFRAGCPVLPFLIRCTERILSEVDPARIAPQIVGPKLLSALHPMAGFTLIDSVGALSPAVIADLVDSQGPALDHLAAASPGPLAGVNLCASVNQGNATMATVIARLQEWRGLAA